MSRKISVLLADNSDYFAVPCANVMKSHGLEVTLTEKDGKTVLEALTKQKYDVVLMDLFLPRLDALGVLEGLGQAEYRPLVMALMMLSSSMAIRMASRRYW